jgi:ubiquinone/menaquinone biosynthesis C-methylase UbiE
MSSCPKSAGRRSGEQETKPHETDKDFVGSVPEVYDSHLVPLIFEPYADDLVARLADLEATSILEVAAGSGVVTRAMAAGLPRSTSITSTDLNQPMIDHAESIGTSRPVVWKQADVADLPFADGGFDAVVCQFGVMFFPDKAAAFAEVARVLRPGGTFLFNVWDAIEHNEFADVVTTAVGTMFPADPPLFLDRTPHGYYDVETIQADLAAGGFTVPAGFSPLEARSRAETATIPAIAYCYGTPLRNEIEARDRTRLSEAVDVATDAIEQRFGATDVDGKIRGCVIGATNP